MDELKMIFDKKKSITNYSGNPITKKAIGLTSDKTKCQRESLKKVINSLNTRKENGETDIALKYRNGVPKIIKTKKNTNSATTSH